MGILSLIYYTGLKIHRWWSSLSAKPGILPTVVVGNLCTGGSGKSPMIAHLAENLLRKGIKPAILSRGYGRKTKGLHVVSPEDSPEAAGDEPLLLKNMFPDIPVICCEDRHKGLQYLNSLPEPPDLVLLDDGFQHRRLIPDFSLVLISREDLREKPRLLPEGKFREPFSALRRANAVVITKVPDEEELDLQVLRKQLNLSAQIPLGYARLRHQLPADFTAKKAVLITGIARPEALVNFLKQQGISLIHLAFKDHYRFNEKDINRVFHYMEQNLPLLTTSKDQVRLRAAGITFAQPVQVVHEMHGAFLNIILQSILDHVGKNRKCG